MSITVIFSKQKGYKSIYYVLCHSVWKEREEQLWGSSDDSESDDDDDEDDSDGDEGEDEDEETDSSDESSDERYIEPYCILL